MEVNLSVFVWLSVVAGSCKARQGAFQAVGSLWQREAWAPSPDKALYLPIVSASHWLPVAASIYHLNSLVCQSLLHSPALSVVSLFLSNCFRSVPARVPPHFIPTLALSSFSAGVFSHAPQARVGPEQRALTFRTHVQMVCRCKMWRSPDTYQAHVYCYEPAKARLPLLPLRLDLWLWAFSVDR